jgi:hypothetical protein
MCNMNPRDSERLERVERLLYRLLQLGRKIMSAVDNLNAAVAQVLQDVADETAELGAAIAAVQAAVAANDPAAVQAAADKLNAAHKGVVDAIAAAQAVIAPPAPTPAA